MAGRGAGVLDLREKLMNCSSPSPSSCPSTSPLLLPPPFSLSEWQHGECELLGDRTEWCEE